jgi:hypothetical protein
MRAFVAILAAATGFLAFRVFQLEAEVHQLQVNAAIAVLSAEAANDKVGAIAPFFAPDKDAFAKAWFDNNNLPQAVFPDDVLVPIRRRLEQQRSTPEAERQRTYFFK